MTDDAVGFGRRYVQAICAALGALDFGAVERIVGRLALAHEHGRRVYTLGNGGSAATAAHMVCDLGTNTSGPSWRGLRVACLTDNSPTATALTNDHGYEAVFATQLTTLLDPGDLVIAVSASGASPNVIAALHVARARSAGVIGLLGFDGGAARALCDEALVVPLFNYGQVEDAHLIIAHIVTQSLRERLADLHRDATPA